MGRDITYDRDVRVGCGCLTYYDNGFFFLLLFLEGPVFATRGLIWGVLWGCLYIMVCYLYLFPFN